MGAPPAPPSVRPREGGGVAEVRAAALGSGHAREVELLLCSARVVPGSGAVERICEILARGVAWPFFLDLVRRHGVGALVYHTLRDVGRGRVPAEGLEPLRADAHALAALVQLRLAQATALLQALEAHGIEALPFKGLALGVLAYGNPILRKPGDLDLLVRREDFERAGQLLVSRGYRACVPVSREARYLKTRSGSTFEHPAGNVDLHWTLAQQAFDSLPFSIKLDARGLRERSVPVEISGLPTRTLSAEDALCYLCAHGARHSWAALYAVCDLAEVIRASPNLDWARVGERVHRLRMRRTFHLGLLLAHGLLDVELPEEVCRSAESDVRALSLACEVSGWLFDPDVTAGAMRHDVAGTVRHHRYNMSLLERPADKATYVVLRGLRMLSKRFPH